MYNLNITPQSKLIIVVLGCLFIGLILSLLYRRKLSENLALLWIFVTIMVEIVLLWDRLLLVVTRLTGARFGALAVSMLAFVFIFAMLIAFSVKVSTLSIQNRRLAQEMALLEQKVDKLQHDTNPSL
ncbi:DUF2304 domain-containing protein [bacterium]|nr:DUF2304 domain-containing protein [bacterium]